MKWFLNKVVESHSSRIIVLPKNRDQAPIACNQFELANRRFHIFIGQAHTQITSSEQTLSREPSLRRHATVSPFLHLLQDEALVVASGHSLLKETRHYRGIRASLHIPMSMAQCQELKGESFAASRARSAVPTQAFRPQQVLQENEWHFDATPKCVSWRDPHSVTASLWERDTSAPRFSD